MANAYNIRREEEEDKKGNKKMLLRKNNKISAVVLDKYRTLVGCHSYKHVM